MRYLLSLALVSGLTLSLLGCGASSEAPSGQQTAQNSSSGPPAGSGGPPTGSAGPPAGGTAGPPGGNPGGSAPPQSPSGAGTGSQLGPTPGGGQNPYGGDNPYGGQNPYSGQGGNPYGGQGGQGNQPYGGAGAVSGGQQSGGNPYGGGGDFRGTPPARPSGAGSGAGGGSNAGSGGSQNPSAPGGNRPPGQGNPYGPGSPPSAGGAGAGGNSGGASAPPIPGGPGDGVPTGGSGGASAPPIPGGPGVPGSGYPGAGGGYPGAGQGNPYDPRRGGTGQAEQEPQTLKDRALQAIQAGNEDDAFQYLYAYYLTDEEGIQEQELGLLPSVNEPRAAIRWGIGVHYIAPRNYTEPPPKIGEEPDLPARGRGGGGRRGGYGQGGPPQLGAPSAGGFGGGAGGGSRNKSDGKSELIYYTGQFGEFLLDRLEQRRTYQGGFYGDFLADIEAGGGQAGNRFGRGGPGGFGASGGGGTGAMSPPGPPGGGYPGAGGRGPGGRGPGGRGAARDEEADPHVAQIQPGVLFLGEGKVSDVLDRARSHGLDGLLMFTVKVSVARTGVARTEAKLDVVDVQSGKDVYTQRRGLNNVSVWRDRQDDPSEENDPIQLELDEIITENADEAFQLKPLPEMSPADAKARVETLISSDYENPLRWLAEIKYYHVEGLIDDETLEAAFVKLIGRGGKDLATGDEEAKLEALESWMPGNFQIEDSGGDGGNFR